MLLTSWSADRSADRSADLPLIPPSTNSVASKFKYCFIVDVKILRIETILSFIVIIKTA